MSNLAHCWSQQGQDIVIVAPTKVSTFLGQGPRKFRSFDARLPFPVIRPLIQTFSSGKIIRGTRRNLGRWSMDWAASRVVGAVGSSDVFVGKFLSSGAYFAKELARRSGKPVFADVGESNIHGAIEGYRSFGGNLVKDFRGFICVSEAICEALSREGVPSERLLFAPNAVDHDIFRPLPKLEARNNLGLDPAKFIVCSIGHQIPRKGIQDLDLALGEIPEIDGIWIGQGYYRPVSKNLQLVGPVNHSQLPYWLSAADCFVLISRKEGHCNAIEEALACGLPVICSNVPEVKAQVRDCAVCIYPGDVGSLVAALRRMRNDPDQRHRLISKGVELSNSRSLRQRVATITLWIQSRM